LKKKKLVAEEPTPLQKSLGGLVFNYVDVLYSERTLGNVKELRGMYSLHAPDHILKYGPLTKITAHQRSLATQPPSTLGPPKEISLNHINFLYLFYYISTFFNFIATIVGSV